MRTSEVSSPRRRRPDRQPRLPRTIESQGGGPPPDNQWEPPTSHGIPESQKPVPLDEIIRALSGPGPAKVPLDGKKPDNQPGIHIEL